jgi:hypothetical protein
MLSMPNSAVLPNRPPTPLQRWQGIGQTHQDRSALVLNAARGHTLLALKAIELAGNPKHRLNEVLAAHLLSLPGRMAELAGGKGAAAALQELQHITQAYAQRPQRSATQWRAAFNDAKHLKAVYGKWGEERIEFDPHYLSDLPFRAFAALRRELGVAQTQALFQGFFFGHAGGENGLLGVVKAWRSVVGERALHGDTLARLMAVINNFEDPVTLHDFEHLVCARGTIPVEEQLLFQVGAANHYNSHSTDQLAWIAGPMDKSYKFRRLIYERAPKLLGLGKPQREPLGVSRTPSLLLASFYRNFGAPQKPLHGKSAQITQEFMSVLQGMGVLAHLDPQELAAVKELVVTDPKRSMQAVLSSSFEQQVCPEAALRPLFQKLDEIVNNASSRVVPASRQARLDLLAREVALQLLLVRHGFRFGQTDINKLKGPAEWSQARDHYGLGSIDFAVEYPTTYQEVRRTIDLVLPPSP